MIRCILIGIFLLVRVSHSYAQQEASHFFFDKGIHVDFSNNSTRIDTNSKIRRKIDWHRTTSASIANKDGKLLFYTDGVTVYTAENEAMKGCEQIRGITYEEENPTCIIFPVDESGYLYYLVTKSLQYHFDTSNNYNYVFTDSLLYYHLIDMRLDNGKGEVVSKNNPIGSQFLRSLTAAKHRNGYDTWLVGRSIIGGSLKKGSPNYYAYLFTSCGIAKELKSSTPGFMLFGKSYKTLLSPNGKLVCSLMVDSAVFSGSDYRAYYYIDHFDDSTGRITPWMKIERKNISSSDFTFSPDSRFFYSILYGDTIGQYDLSLLDSGSIVQSVKKIATKKSDKTFKTLIGLQNIPRGRTLVTIYDHDVNNTYPYEGVIEQPNREAPNCGFSEYGLYLPSKIYSTETNPTYFMSSFFRPGYKTPEPFKINPSIEVQKIACAYDSVALRGQSADSKIDSLVWVIENAKGDTVAGYKGKEWKTLLPVGKYTATLTVWRSCVNASTKTEFVLEGKPSASINGKEQDTLRHCGTEPVILQANEGNYKYTWNTEEMTKQIKPSQNGAYEISVTNTCGTVKAKVWLEDDKWEIPNIITPNGDGVNDEWHPKNLSGTKPSVKILNRWGSVVYETQEYSNNWQAEGVPDGVYFYQLTSKGDCLQKGWVQVLR